MAINSIQELFTQLLKSTTAQQLTDVLSEIGDVTDIGLDRPFGNLELHWHAYGNKTSNYSTIGLASKPGRSLTERITNSIDAVIDAHALTVGTSPSSPQAAVQEWFGRPFSNADNGLFNWKYNEGGYDRKVAVVLTDSGKKEAPTVDTIDFGVGIPADAFPTTILSLQEGNKIKKKYLVGAFGQGGSSTLAFCEYVFILSKSVQNPNIVSFTVVKEISLGDEYKENCYAYLALKTENNEQTVPSFTANEHIKLYDSQESLRMNELQTGTLIRHFAFRLTGIFGQIGPREGNLYHYLHMSLFDPLIPFQIIDLRKSKVNQQICTGSRNRLMKLKAKADENSELDSSNSEHKLYRPFVYIKPHGAPTPCIKIEYWVVFNFEKKNHKITGEEYFDLRESNTLYVQKKHIAVLTLNGQNQGELTTSQVTKDLDLDSVAKHLIIHIDATDAPNTVRRQLFTTNREQLKDGDVLESIKEELRRILKDDEGLAAIEKQLQDMAIRQVTAATDDEVKKQIVRLLQEAGFTPSAEGDAIRKGGDAEMPNPQPNPNPDPPPASDPIFPLLTLPYPDVNKFEIVSPLERAKIHLGKTLLIRVETDGDSQFDKDIRIKFTPEILDISSVWPLEGGRKKWRIKPIDGARIGDSGTISITLTKPNGDQLKADLPFEVLAQIEKSAKEERGHIPDFEVLPISPGDDNWSTVWDDIPEHSEEASAVAYIPIKIGNKTIVYYSTAFTPFKTVVDKLRLNNSPLYTFFETNYKVWIGYHGILQYNSTQNETFDGDETMEDAIKNEREADRALIAQMQVKQAYKSSELMFQIQKQKAVIAD